MPPSNSQRAGSADLFHASISIQVMDADAPHRQSHHPKAQIPRCSPGCVLPRLPTWSPAALSQPHAVDARVAKERTVWRRLWCV